MKNFTVQWCQCRKYPRNMETERKRKINGVEYDTTVHIHYNTKTVGVDVSFWNI